MTQEDIQKINDKLRKERENRIPNIIKWLEEMGPFTEEHIPEPPILDKELYDKYVIPNFIRCGAISKDKLIPGKVYFGSCRNTDKAWWLGDCFEYKRTKFGFTYNEGIKHFEDGGGYSTDVFVPIEESVQWHLKEN
jgi:hypothetical protein